MHNGITGTDAFSQEKEQFAARLDAFNTLIKEAKDKSISPELEESFGKTIQKVEDLKSDLIAGKLKIALVGEFSGGKTSTIAGFLGHADPSMKIATEESSDKIEYYAPEKIDADVPPCEFVDTPGLFGQKFSQITKDYVSQAHVVLYIVNATNPLPESHRATVGWLMNTLQKFDKAIFVINQMDNECDYTDPEDFDHKRQIKCSFLRNNVARYCEIAPDDERIKSLNVVCIASDPDKKGLMDDGNGHVNYWLTAEHREKYEMYSRMSDLRRMVSDVVRKTVPQTLMCNVVLAAVNEEVRVNCEKLQDELRQLEEAALPEVEDLVNRLDADIKTSRNDLRREIRPCLRELESLEKGVCEKIRVATLESFNSVVEDEVGAGDDAGYRIQSNIYAILSDHFEHIISQTCEKISSDIELGEANVSAAMSSIKNGAATIGTLAKGVDKAMIFAGRELLGKIGIVIKFKPWEAAKLANFASKTLPVIGTVVSFAADIGGMIAKNVQEQKLAKAKSDLLKAVQELFKCVYDNLRDETKFYENLTPQVLEMEKQLADARRHYESLKNASYDGEVMRCKLAAFWSSTGNEGVKADVPASRKGLFSFLRRK